VSNKHGHRGEHEVSRKTIARGMPGCSGVTVVTTLVCLFFTHEAAGASRARHSLRPLMFRRRDVPGKPRAKTRGEIAKLCVMRTSAPSPHMSSPGLTGRPSIPETPENNREAAAYWIVRSSRTTTVVWKASKQSSVVPANAGTQPPSFVGVEAVSHRAKPRSRGVWVPAPRAQLRTRRGRLLERCVP
jgi:hypothetical protein